MITEKANKGKDIKIPDFLIGSDLRTNKAIKERKNDISNEYSDILENINTKYTIITDSEDQDIDVILNYIKQNKEELSFGNIYVIIRREKLYAAAYINISKNKNELHITPLTIPYYEQKLIYDERKFINGN